MKSIFGILSLIAILTVSFTATATTSANDSPTKEVVYDIGVHTPVIVVASADVEPIIFEFGNVFDEQVVYDIEPAVDTVNCTSGQEDAFVTDGSVKVSITDTINSITFADLPIDYGIRITDTNIETSNSCSEPDTSRENKSPDTSRENKSKDSFGTRYVDSESPVGWSTEVRG